MAEHLFDRIVIIDWSAANSPKLGADSIWIADSHGLTLNLPTRYETIVHVRAIIEQSLRQGDRLLIGWDFAFGYPSGFAKSIEVVGWDGIWDWLSDHVEDGPDNRSNRFQVAARVNRSLGQKSGPFWGYVGKDCPEGLSPKRYSGGVKQRWPFTDFAYLREIEHHLPAASPVFKLAYSGSVGSQTLLGLPRLNRLRKRFPDAVAIWPFETDFARDLSKPVIFAEIYPSAHIIPDGPETKDRRQVESVLRDFAVWDQNGTLKAALKAPSLHGDRRARALNEEGWIAGQ